MRHQVVVAVGNSEGAIQREYSELIYRLDLSPRDSVGAASVQRIGHSVGIVRFN